MVVGDVHGVVLPVLQADDPQRGAVADDELDVVGVDGAALVLEDDDGLGERLDPDHDVAVGGAVAAAAPAPDTVGSASTASSRHGRPRRLLEGVVGLARSPGRPARRPADPGVVAAHRSRRSPLRGVAWTSSTCRR